MLLRKERNQQDQTFLLSMQADEKALPINLYSILSGLITGKYDILFRVNGVFVFQHKVGQNFSRTRPTQHIESVKLLNFTTESHVRLGPGEFELEKSCK